MKVQDPSICWTSKKVVDTDFENKTGLKDEIGYESLMATQSNGPGTEALPKGFCRN